MYFINMEASERVTELAIKRSGTNLSELVGPPKKCVVPRMIRRISFSYSCSDDTPSEARLTTAASEDTQQIRDELYLTTAVQFLLSIKTSNDRQSKILCTRDN